MTKVESTTFINAPVDTIWEFISDPTRGPEWVEVMESVISDTPGPKGGHEGRVYVEGSKIGPVRMQTEWKVTKFDPNAHVQVHECRQPDMIAILTMTVTPQDNGANLTHEIDIQMMPKFRPLGWLLEKAFVVRKMNSDIKKTQLNAARIIEAEYEQESK